MGKSYEILHEAANEMKSIVEKRFDQVNLLSFSEFSTLILIALVEQHK